MSFAEKWIELEIIMLSEIRESQEPNITYSPSFVEPRPKMMMMMRMIIMGHEYERVMVWGINGRGAKQSILSIHYMYAYIFIYEDSIMKPTKHCFKRREKMEIYWRV
jgi:hypothetical protein